MSLWNKVKAEFIDIIEWTQPDASTVLAYRFPRYQNEIKMGAKLTVREGQAAVFVNEGKIADVFPPGMHTLSTQNLPVLSTLRGWKYGFDSPFKAEVYFVSTKEQTGHKWGTSNPLIKRDPDFGIVRMRAFGSYTFKVVDPAKFLRELVATDPQFDDFEIDTQLRQVILAEFAQVLGTTQAPLLDLLASYQILADFVKDAIRDDFESWGLEIRKFFVENVSVPKEVETAIDKRSSMGAVGDLSKYMKYQTAEAVREAVQGGDGSGTAQLGAGFGVGLTMAQALSQSFGASAQATANSPVQGEVPPPLPSGSLFHVALQGKPQGPFAVQDVSHLIASGQVTAETLVWKSGLAAWEPAAKQPELAGFFANQPPPLPGQ
jgi:membrane protease subunit (stomatin/prohibitin family)